MPLDNLFGQFSQVGQTLPGLGENTPSVLPSLPSQEAAVEPEVPPNDPTAQESFADILKQFAPLAPKAVSAAMKLPSERTEELYKERIRKMFGVKLGEKNPKWKSILRVLGEGALDIGSTRYGGPTIRGAARKQALEDYKAENDVLGKESTSILARMGQAAQQGTSLQIAKMREESKKLADQLKNSPTTPRGKLYLAQAEKARAEGDYNLEGVILRRAQAELANARTNDVGQTNKTREVNFFEDNAKGLGVLAQISAASKAKLKTPGEDDYTTLLGRRWQAVVGPDGNMVNREIPTERQVKRPEGFASMEDLRRAYQTEGTSAATGKETNQVPGTNSTPAPPMQSSAPAGGQGTPHISKQPTPTTTNPNPTAPLAQNLNPQKVVENHDDFSATERQLENDLKRKNVIFGRDKQKAYEGLKEQVRGGRGVMGSLFGTMFSFDGEGTPSLQNATGVRGMLNTLKGKSDGKMDSSIVVANQAFRKINDDYRKWVTGQGAGMPELKRIAARYPALGDTASAFEGPEYAIQKGLALHFLASLQKYRMLQEEAAPDSLGTFFPEKEVGDRIGQITDLYKKMRDILPKTAPGDRKKVAEQYRKVIGELSDPMKLYADTYRAQFGDLSKAPRY